MNAIINKTMGRDLPQLEGEPEVGKWYAIDIDNAVSSDGSKWQGYFRKGSENKVVLYFYGGGFSVNDYTAARSMDVEGGFYNPRLNTGLNVMTYAIKERFFDEGSQKDMPLTIGKAEGDRFQQILKKMVADMQEQIPGCGIYIWDEEAQADGHLTVHTATGTKIYFDSKSRNPSIAQWLENAVNGNVESFGLELLDRNF